jgi:predicted nucleic acid-binding protein
MLEVAVLDASAVLDAATPGPRFDLMTRLHERLGAEAPALLAWELGSVVHGRKGRVFGSGLRKRADNLEMMLGGIDLVTTDEAGRRQAAALAARHGLTFYDASYLEVAARREGRCLVTQDAALLVAGARELGAGRVARLDDIGDLLLRAEAE